MSAHCVKNRERTAFKSCCITVSLVSEFSAVVLFHANDAVSLSVHLHTQYNGTIEQAFAGIKRHTPISTFE